MDQEFLITDFLELHRLLSVLRAVNHKKSEAGVAMTSPWLSCTISSSPFFSLNLPDTHLTDMPFIFWQKKTSTNLNSLMQYIQYLDVKCGAGN